MSMAKANPFDECPVYETERFTCRLVHEDDAEDLFLCYSDPVTASHANGDNCKGAFRCTSAGVMKDWICGWRNAYAQRTFVRWSVIDKGTGKAVGTMEIAPLPWGRWFFGKQTPIGILRLDLLSACEQYAVFDQLVGMMATALANDFAVNQVIMKALPGEQEKVSALTANQFQPYALKNSTRQHYYIRFCAGKA